MTDSMAFNLVGLRRLFFEQPMGHLINYDPMVSYPIATITHGIYLFSFDF